MLALSACLSFSCANRVATLSAVSDLIAAEALRSCTRQMLIRFFPKARTTKAFPEDTPNLVLLDLPLLLHFLLWLLSSKRMQATSCAEVLKEQWPDFIRFPRPSVISCMVLKPCFRRSCIDFKAFGHGLNRTQWNIHCAIWAISGPQSKHPSFCSSLSTSRQWPANQKVILISQSGFKMFEMDRKSSPELHVINKYHQLLFALESISDLTNSSVTATLSHKSRRVFCIGKTRLFEAKGWA